MPFIRDVAVTEITAAATTGTAEMPNHVSGDILVVWQVKDTNTAITQSGANYTVLRTQESAGASGLTAWRRATSRDEPPWISTWASETSVIVVAAIGGAHGTNAPSSAMDAADDSTIPFTPTAAIRNP